MTPTSSSPVLLLFVVALVLIVTLLLLRKIYRAFLGKERVPLYWILGHLFGGRWGGFLGNQIDLTRPERQGSAPNWAAVVFYLLLLIGWVSLLRAFYQAGR